VHCPTTTTCASLLLLAACRQADPPAPAPERPHLVIVSLDTVRWDHTGQSGYHRDTTPSLDELAALPGSTSFERAYAAAAWSLPSYASIFTGLDAFEHGVGLLQAELDPAYTTLAQVLTAYGYHSAAFTSGGHLHPATGLGRGFETYVHLSELAPMAPVVNQALAWLDKQPQGEPLLLFVAGYDAHEPYASPAAYTGSYVADYAHAPTGGPEDPNMDPCRHRGPTRACMRALPEPDPEGNLDPEQRAFVVAHYDTAILTADYGLGRLLQGLEERGLLEHSLVVALADHGEGLGETGGRFHHDNGVGDGVFHVPLVIRRPGDDSPARRSAALVSLESLAPTLLGELGLEPPVSSKAPSFAAALDPSAGEQGGVEAVIGASLCCSWVRDEGWELQGRLHEPGAPMTWSLLRDGQGEDQSAAQPERVSAMQRHLAHWPAHPGRPSKLPARMEPQERRALRQALREGGYWTPDEQPGEGNP
jgi:arylsulfatase A-like enzyme